MTDHGRTAYDDLRRITVIHVRARYQCPDYLARPPRRRLLRALFSRRPEIRFSGDQAQLAPTGRLSDGPAEIRISYPEPDDLFMSPDQNPVVIMNRDRQPEVSVVRLA